MSEIVAAVATIHAPFIVGRPDWAPPARRQRVEAGFRRLRAYLEGQRPDVIWAFSSEHLTNFLSTHVPAFCLGIGDSNPLVPEFTLPAVRVPGDAQLARGFLAYAYDHGFDVSYSTELRLDHGTGMPLYYLTPDFQVPVVVLLTNTIWSPMPTLARCYALGAAVRDFLAQDGLGRRVALLATGGISHWVGNARHGDVDQAFDVWFLDRVTAGDSDALLALSQAAIDAAGDGANEIRNWVALLGAVAGRPAEVVCDETFIPGWNTSAYQVIWH